MSNRILVLDRSIYDYGKAIEGLGKLTCNLSDFYKHTEKFSLVLFTGGADVDPSFYNDTSPQRMCGSVIERDKLEKRVFLHALSNHTPMAGICRGFQFLNVMAKGRLIHHLSDHAGSIHPFDGPNLVKPIMVNSFHHQMVVPHESTHVIGWLPKNLSDNYYGKNDQQESWNKPEVESAIFPNINACGVQYHPEWMPTSSDGYQFFYKLASELIDYSMEEFMGKYVKGKKYNEQKPTDVRTCFDSTTG